MLQKISDIIHNGLPIVYIRHIDEIHKRMIFEYIEEQEKQEKINSIFWEKFYISELDEKEQKELIKLIENDTIFLTKNIGLVEQERQQEVIVKTTEKLVKSLSWSKIYQWLNNKKGFIKTYFEKEPFFETKEIIFWSALWKMIEIQEYHDEDRIVEECMTRKWERKIDIRKEKLLRISINNIKQNTDFTDKLQELEFDLFSEYENEFKDFINWVCTLWFSDNCSADWKWLKEFKTGKTPWDSERVNNHGQLDIYCLLTYLKKGYLPNDIELIWFPTENNENWEIIPTWEIKRFNYDVEKNKERIMKWEDDIPRIFEEIQEAQAEWERQKEEENVWWLNENLIVALSEIDKLMKELKERAEAIKEEINKDMESCKLKDYKLDWVWTVYYTTRKTYKYPDEIKESEKEIKAKKKEYEQSEKAEYTEKRSISFRLN